VSTSTSPRGWLLLLYSLPAKKASGRVNLWRKLKKSRAYALKTSAYVLPDEPAHLERFQWLVQQVRDEGCEATLARVTNIEGCPTTTSPGASTKLAPRTTLRSSSRSTNSSPRIGGGPGDGFADALEKLQRQFQEVRAIDYFGCPAAHDVEMLLHPRDRSRHPANPAH